MNHSLFAALAAGLVALSAGTNVQAETSLALAPVFTDHAVLQRDKPISLWGKATPNATVTLTLRKGEQVLARASARSEATGGFRVSLPRQTAGGPYILSLSDETGHTQTLQDILIGDVWLCSGQSNMEYPLKAATNGGAELAGAYNPQLRILDVPRNSQPSPVTDFKVPTQWKVSSPQTATDTSAVCYFMARQLAETYQVPQGMIHASWGGTAAELWMSPAALGTIEEMRPVLKAQALYRTDPKRANAYWKTSTDEWWRTRDPDAQQAQLWAGKELADAKWPTMTVAGMWETNGIEAFKAFDGIVWYRQTITLTKEQASRAVTLELGAIDDSDTTWVNGSWVGATDGWDQSRRYTLPKGVLKAGANVIAVRVLDSGGGGGLYGAPSERALVLDDGTRVALSAQWRYHLGADITKVGSPPVAPWAAGPTLLYNGMIAPLAPYTLKGIAWYQGEANAANPPLYGKLLPKLVSDWRAQFQDDTLSFLVVQLSAFGAPQTTPYNSNWAAIRDIQRRLEQDDPRVGLAVSYDVGDRFDIHPTQKRQVGLRLALAARKVGYGETLNLGPRPQRVYRRGNDLIVAFSGVTGTLRAYGGKDVLGFEVCSTTCHFASARLEDNLIVLPGEGTHSATEVRFGWTDVPILNLYDGADLPATPFSLAINP